jgi:S-adenosylmethionine/arginine decarboxylase-like enzyme
LVEQYRIEKKKYPPRGQHDAVDDKCPKLDHKHIIVNATVKQPLVDVEGTKKWLKDLVEAVNMKIVLGPFAEYCNAEGNEGITGCVCIQTSHCSIHVWDKLKPAIMRLDLYSCDTFERETVLNHLKYFEPITYEWITLDRNDKIKILEQGEIKNGSST